MEERYSRRILLLKQVMITEEKLRILKTLIRKLFLWKIGKKSILAVFNSNKFKHKLNEMKTYWWIVNVEWLIKENLSKTDGLIQCKYFQHVLKCLHTYNKLKRTYQQFNNFVIKNFVSVW